MTDHRQLISGASCWAVGLSFAMALPSTKSDAQPLAPLLSVMPFWISMAPWCSRRLAAVRAARVGDEAGERAVGRELSLALAHGLIAGGGHTADDAAGANGTTVSNLK